MGRRVAEERLGMNCDCLIWVKPHCLQCCQLSSLLEQKAVLLRIEAGSTEAGFLAAFCDITAIPTFVVIQNGQLQLHLKSDTTQNDFINAVRKVLGANPIPGSSVTHTSTSQSETPPAQNIPPENAEDDLYGTGESPQSVTHVAAQSSKAKGKQKAIPASESKSDTSSRTLTAAQQAARDAVRKKKREEAEELARVKARIEADKAERKAQAEARKAERELERTTEAQSDIQSRAHTSSKGSQAKKVNLQVRLFDGRTIRSTFDRTCTLEKEVRKWIDETFTSLSADDPNINSKRLPPYYFRHILTPLPSRELSAGDENQTLGDIDLAPSATLVLVPVKGYTDAYTDSGGGVVGSAVGAATGLVGGAFGLLSSTIGFVGSTLGSVVGYGSATAEPSRERTVESAASPPAQAPATSEGSTIRVRTLADQRAREPRDQQFYNGNQVSNALGEKLCYTDMENS